MSSEPENWREPVDQLRGSIALLRQRLPLMSEPEQAALIARIEELERVALEYESNMSELLKHRNELIEQIDELEEGDKDGG